MPKPSPHKIFYSCAALITLLTGLPAFFLFELNTLASCFLSINTTTLLLFAWDKRSARAEELRVPESVLLMLALIGGSPAVLIGMMLFRHKTRDRTFLPPLALLVILQIGVAYWLASSS